MISTAGSTCDVCHDVLVHFYTLYASGFVLGRLIWPFETRFRFVGPVVWALISTYSMMVLTQYQVVLYLDQTLLSIFPRSGIGRKDCGSRDTTAEIKLVIFFIR